MVPSAIVAAECESRATTPERGTAPRVLILAYWYPPENTSGAQRPFRFARYLPEFGYEAVVVTSSTQPSAGPQQVFETPEQKRGLSAFLSRALRMAERVLPYNDRLPWAPAAFGTAAQVVRRVSPVCIVSTAPPMVTHLVALLCKWRFRVRWIADFRDPLLGNPFRSRWWGRIHDALLERLIVAAADGIIANTDSAVAMLRGRYPAAAGRIHLIWNGYDPEEPLEPAAIPDRPYRTLLHVGTLYGGRHPGMLLAAIDSLVRAELLDAGRIRLRLWGPVDTIQTWQRQYANAPWLEYRDELVHRAEAQAEMSRADCLVLLDLNEKDTGLQVPAKVFEYIRIGRPILVLTSRGSATERILAGSGIRHICLHPGDTEEENGAKLLELLRMPTDPLKPSPSFEARFNGREQTRSLAEIIAR